MSVLKSFFKSVGKGLVNYGEKSLDDAVKLGKGTLNIGAKAGEKIIDSAMNEGGKLNKIGKTLFEKIPEAEREGLVDELLPYKMKKHKTKLDMSEAVKDADGKVTKGPRVMVNGKETSAVGTKLWQGSTWMKDTLIKSPGGKIALGITGVGFGIGVFEGSNAAKIGNVEGERIANTVSEEMSPYLHDRRKVENAEVHGLNNYGADGNIVFALHNMR